MMVYSSPFPWPRVLCLLASTFVISTFTPALCAGQAVESSGCVSQNPAGQLIKQAQDPQGSAESRLSAYYKATELCPNDLSLYIELTTLLVRTQRTQHALIWAQRGL